MEDDLKQRRRKEKNDIKKNQNLFLIPLKFWGKPFLGLAQLSKIFDFYEGCNEVNSRTHVVIHFFYKLF